MCIGARRKHRIDLFAESAEPNPLICSPNADWPDPSPASIASGYVQTGQNDPKRTLIVGARTTPAKEGNSENANRHCAPYCALFLSSFKRLIVPTAIEAMPIAMQRPVPATIQPTPAPIIPREIKYASIVSLISLNAA